MVLCLQEMNKINAYAQTKIDPKEIVEIFKKKFMVSHIIKYTLLTELLHDFIGSKGELLHLFLGVRS